MAFYHRRLHSDEIRLLTLLPGKPKDEIQCSLQIVPLDNLPAFDALSYVWGDHNVTKPIIVENESRQATVNLFMALRNLRKRKERRLLWVDALCINQGDLDEKNTQVPLMAKIYSVATHVIAWLGPSTPEIELYSQWVQTYVAKSYNISSVSWLMLDAAALFLDRLQERKLVKQLKAVQGHLQLVQLPYWHRMWTYQEYQLASEEPVCICGNVVCHPTELEASMSLIWNTLWSARARFEVGLHSRFLRSDKSSWTEYEKLNELLPGIESVLTLEHKGITHAGMYYLLRVTVWRKCSDPLDKFYSLYGLCPGIQAVYPPDYQKTPETVRHETTAYIINHEREVTIYTRFGMRNAALDDESFPSWIPDFDHPASSNFRNLHPTLSAYNGIDSPAKGIRLRHGSFDDQFSHASTAAIDDTLTILHLPARDLGGCQVTFRFGDQYDEVLDKIQRLLQDDPASPKYNATGRVPREKIARLCVADDIDSIRYSDAEFLAEFDRLFVMKAQGGSHRESWDGINLTCEQAVQGLKGKTLFSTEGGLLGIGVGAINDGDILILAPEVEFPLLLRPKDRVSTDGVRGQHRLVGTAYVDGVMAPLSLDPDVDAEVSRLEVKVFDIW